MSFLLTVSDICLSLDDFDTLNNVVQSMSR